MDSIVEANESNRYQNLKSFRILDTPRERVFDDLVKMASEICQTPMAMISLIDQDRQWVKAQVGIPFTETERKSSFCSQAIFSPEPLVVEDAFNHPDFRMNPFVLSEPHIRFYAGIPLLSQEGFALGALCVLDRVPRILNEKQMRLLENLAYQVSYQLERHRLGVRLSDTRKLVDILSAKLDGSSKMASLGAMTASVAHEINNPLTIIQGRSMLLSRAVKAGDVDPKVIIEGCEKISDTVGRIHKIVRGLKNASRLDESGGVEQIDIQTLVDETISFCRERFDEERVSLQVGKLSKRVTVFCKPVEFSQVLLNLLNNALDAIVDLPERWVRVSFLIYEGKLGVRVTDSGHGIPKEVVQKMFEPFFTTKPSGQGTGLGLSISKKMMALQGGELLYREETTNTSFEIRIPRINE